MRGLRGPLSGTVLDALTRNRSVAGRYGWRMGASMAG
jgi:hypothetical protein